ncbi:MAG: LytR family transcriptional regulator [Solirubrobacterales bacterium]|nr:LytR family transcriptional regulator [Solirubrobacterales bacterium]
MPEHRDDPPQYTRYRARRRLLPGREQELARPSSAPPAPRRPARPGRDGGGRRGGEPGTRAGWRRWATRKRIAAGVLALVLGWLVLSLLLFLISSHFERTSPPRDVAGVLDSAGYPLTSANNILVLGSDTRQKNSKEPGAEKSGPGRSDSIMLIRTGGGHAARLSIPRDTVVEIPGHGMQKINAAHAFGGPAESISVIKRWLGIPINHVVEVNFENFPQLIDSMGGVDYTGGCVISRIDGGFSRGGYTLRLPRGTHHLDGKQALALARTRENLCAPSQTDLQREEHQQALFNAMKSRLLSPSSFFRLPWIAWHAPPAIISDMSGPTLLGLFAALGTSGTPPTRIMKPSGAVTLPGGGQGLSVSEGERRAAVARFMKG